VTPYLIDTHCHIHFPSFDATRDAVLLHMMERRIGAITVGTTAKTSREAILFAEAHNNVWATVGYHPEHFTSSFHDEDEGDVDTYDIEALRTISTSSKKVVAIGEVGLDFFRIDEGMDLDEAHALQERGLREQIALATELDLPLTIHCRDAFVRLAEILSDERTRRTNLRGVVHCFTGNWTEAKMLLDIGFHISFTGIVTFPPKKTQDPETSVHRVIERMPLERIIIETDAPWLAPVPHRGEQNEPAYVGLVAQKVAELRKMPLEDVARQTTENAISLFRLS